MGDYVIVLINNKMQIDKFNVSKNTIKYGSKLQAIFLENWKYTEFKKEVTINVTDAKIIPAIFKSIILLKNSNANSNDRFLEYLELNYDRIFDIIYIVDYIGFDDYLNIVKNKINNIFYSELLLNSIQIDKDIQPTGIYLWEEL